jgi:hypothetical protein
MAALTLRQVAEIYTRQAAAYDKLAKERRRIARDLPQGVGATEAELQAATAAFDHALRYFHSAESATEQATHYTQLANDAGEPA